MVNYSTVLVTSRRFRVRDVEAFRRDLEREGFDVEVEVDGEGRVWIGGEGASLVAVDEEGEEHYLEDVIRRHIEPGEVAVIRFIGYEGLRGVDGAVLAVTSEGAELWTMGDAEEELVRELAER